MIKPMRVLGLDAAFANVGLAFGSIHFESAGFSQRIEVEDLELIKTQQNKVDKKVVRKNSDDLRRAREIVTGIEAAIKDKEIDLVCVEVPVGAQSARAAWTLGMVVGILASIRCPLIEVTPREVKLAVGDKFAEKQEIIAWATKLHPAAPWPRQRDRIITGSAEHLADAVASIYAGVATEEFKRMSTYWRSVARYPEVSQR